MKKIVLLFLCLIISVLVFSQKIQISGYVYAKKTGESILDANIYVPTSKYIAITNEYGYYSFSVPSKDSILLIISCMGYETKKIKISAKKNTVFNIYLQAEDYKLAGVVVNGQKHRQHISTNSIPIKIAKLLPAIGGENDIMKIYSLMPGVQTAENRSSLMVRGGSGDENLIILDDVPLYYVNHLGGFVSVFNTDALKQARLIKGGFPAHYGNRLSSVFDVRMKDGDLKKFKKQISIGILSSKLSIEGPIEKNKSSFIVSARRFNLDLISRPITYIIANKVQGGYYFYDLNLKLNRKFDDKNRLFFSFYSGDDKTFIIYKKKDRLFLDKNKSEQSASWGNMLFALRFNHIFNPNFFSNTTLSYTRYRNENSIDFKEYENRKMTNQNIVSFYSGIKDYRLNTDFQLFISQNYSLRFGANIISHFYTPGKNNFLLKTNDSVIIDTSFNDTKLNALEFNSYVENKIKIGKFKANLGLRFNYFFINNKAFPSVEPRINTSFDLAYDFQITSSFSTMQQNVHQISFASTGIPLKIWIPATSDEIPEISNQITFGINKSFVNKYSFSIEAYYKKMKNLIEMKNSTVLFSPEQNYQNFIAKNGQGICYGLEFMLQKYIGNFQGWIAYTYSKANRLFQDINQGQIFPFDFDRRHSVTVVASYRISKKIALSADWIYGSGFPFSLVDQKYLGFVSISKKNNMRMQDYNRLDISIKLTRERKNKFVRTWSFDIYNVYNRKNPTFYTVREDREDGKIVQNIYKFTMFPIIPSISYSIKF